MPAGAIPLGGWNIFCNNFTSHLFLEGMATAARLKVGATFPTWEEATRELDDIAKERFFVWVTDTSNSIAAENKKVISRGETELYDTNLKYKNVTLVCSFGGKKRIGSGTGARPIQA